MIHENKTCFLNDKKGDCVRRATAKCMWLKFIWKPGDYNLLNCIKRMQGRNIVSRNKNGKPYNLWDDAERN